LFCEIPDKVIKDAKKAVEVVGDAFIKNYHLIEGVETYDKDVLECYLNRSQRPSFTIIGVDGIPSVTNGGNVVRPKTTFSCSCRLPPYLPTEKAVEVINKLVTTNVPYGAKVEFKVSASGNGFYAPQLPKE